MHEQAPRFALVAGETSGDRLAAGLIRALRARYPQAEFEGVTGPEMAAAGCTSLASADELALMGVSEVVSEIPRLLKLRRRLYRHLTANPPDVFIGVDAPAFNTGLELKLRRAGIVTAHYVCPTAWAWREGRTRKIRKAVDLLLAIFPFEPEFFARHDIEARFVGHPLADALPMEPDVAAARAALEMPIDDAVQWVGLLPGSRRSEVTLLGPRFLQTANWLRERLPEVKFIAPMASPKVRGIFEQQVTEHGLADAVVISDGHARDVMAVADVLLVASGTATLEAMLLKTPMVVAYAGSPLNAFLAQTLGLLKAQYVSMPNLLAGRELVPELLQNAAEPRLMGAWLYRLLTSADARAAQTRPFYELHEQMAQGADQHAADAIAELVEK